ncbi:O-antigen ligase family protein [Desulfotalea psychrophila]|uniref:O-antigen ligase-related domain-containing protein n=1 Tax=Desulfotalea psychrophila (strain LSv54 / DSM 12343) TaxID=177439 RepID=Q6ASB4_DESPS|nr:O-antigen ligase family protein [Desulfotalea psychrophila]CAG34749.1 unknown protein [Desulfotalea psychrophila LSv54]
MLTEKKMNYLEWAGVTFIALACFCSVITTTGKTITTILFILSWLLARGYKEFVPTLRRYPMALSAFALFILYCVGISYSVGPMDEVLDRVKGMRGLLFPAMVIFFCRRQRKGVDWVVNAFLAAFVVLLIETFFVYFGQISRSYGWAGAYNSPIHPSFSSGMMALLFYVSCHRLKDSSILHRLFWGGVALLSFADIFYLQRSLTGMVVFFALALLLLVQTLSWKKMFVGGLMLALSLVVLVQTSPKFMNQGRELYNTVTNYQEEISHGKFNNVSLRIAWQINSLKLIAEAPFLGTGPASFPVVHGELIRGTRVPPMKGPHNAFLLVGVEAGLAGMALFIAALLFAARASFTLESRYRLLLQGVLLTFVVGSLCDSWLGGSSTGYLFTILVPALLSSKKWQGEELAEDNV